jgi:hypothetical protein
VAYWDVATTAYIASYQYLYTFDANGNNLSSEYQTWNTTTNAWVPSSKSMRTYDSNNNVSVEIDQTWNTGTTSFDNTDRYVYTYQSFNVNNVANYKDELGITLYPNPAAGANVNLNLTIETATILAVNVYDAQGRLVSTEDRNVTAGANNFELGYAAMPAGNYIVQVIDRATGKTSALKFIKQ